MQFKRVRRYVAVLMLTVFALSATFTPVAVDAYAATEYTKTEKRIASTLAKSVVTDLKSPESFDIVEVLQGSMEVDKRLKNYVDSPYASYEYAVKYKAKNGKGGYSYGWVFLTSSFKVWQPDKYKYYAAVETEDGGSVNADMIRNISRLTSEYFKDISES